MIKNVTNDNIYIGVNDHKIDLFEGQYVVPNGMAYNSYVVLDEKITVFDTMDINFTNEWLSNLDEALAGKSPDYLVVQHMEPDHSASIDAFMEKYPSAKIVANAKTFAMIKQFFGKDYCENQYLVKDGDTLVTGKHEFTFVFAPMVHWPEVMVTYDSYDKILFSADGFGKFGAIDIEEPWEDEARRYYIGIVGKYGVQVQNLLKKAGALDIEKICPLHGPVLTENLGHYIDLYDKWSSYKAECEDVVIAFSSVYGNTKKAVHEFADKIREAGTKNVKVYDLARCDMAEAVAEAFKCESLVLATTTYNADIFPCMREFVDHLTERNYQKRKVAIIENGSWAPMAAKVIKKELECSKNLELLEPVVTIKSALDETSRQALNTLAAELAKA